MNVSITITLETLLELLETKGLAPTSPEDVVWHFGRADGNKDETLTVDWVE